METERIRKALQSLVGNTEAFDAWLDAFAHDADLIAFLGLNKNEREVSPEVESAIKEWQKKMKTIRIHAWMKNLDDGVKQHFAINWKMAHTLFNVACKFYPGGADQLQGVDWYGIYKSRDLGTWSHGGRVYTI